MLNLILLAICIADGILVFKVLKAVLFGAFGDSKIFRTIKIFFAFPCGVGYTCFALYIGLVSYNVSMLMGAVIIFAPLGIFTALCIFGYIKDGK